MLSPLRSPIAIVCIAVVLLGVYVRTMREQVDIARRVARDDWHGVRDVAGALLTGERRASGTVVAHASVVLGVAHLVLGDLAAARSTIDDALGADLPAPLVAMAHRQLASVERISGSFPAALARLARPDASASPEDGWAVALQRALVHLDAGDPVTAAQEAGQAVDAVTVLLGRAHTSAMRSAWSADLVQAQCVLVRALAEHGDTDRADAVWAARATADDRPYVQAQVAETSARLALARGQREVAKDAADAARRRYEQVGAAIDVARLQVLGARIERDVVALDDVEAELRTAGALGHLREVAEARREIEGLG